MTKVLCDDRDCASNGDGVCMRDVLPLRLVSWKDGEIRVHLCDSYEGKRDGSKS